MKHTRLRHADVALLIGAEVELLDVIRAVLMEEAHFHIITATAPDLILPLIETTSPGVVVLDLNLPEQKCWDILTTLRQDPRFRTLPVVLLSPVDEDAVRVASFHDPWVEFILKPFDLDTVLQRIQYLVHQQKGAARAAQKRKVDTVESASLPPASSLLLLGERGK
jgi:DNA-binding response OmpR family regulator